VPLVHEAFADYRTGGAFFSAAAMRVVKDLISGKEPTQESSGLSKREWRELMELLERPE
jgi:thymidylate synthase (FAD)